MAINGTLLEGLMCMVIWCILAERIETACPNLWINGTTGKEETKICF